jgi:hypothetical protein
LKTLVIVLLLCVTGLAQQPQYADKPAPKSSAPVAAALDAADQAKWIELRQPINDAEEQIAKLVATARAGRPKTADQKAMNWTEFEVTTPLAKARRLR